MTVCAATQAPSAPTVTAIDVGDTVVTLTWSYAAFDPFETPSDVWLLSSPPVTGEAPAFIVTSYPNTTTSIIGLVNDVGYVFQLAVSNSIGRGAYTPLFGPLTPLGSVSPPSQPLQLILANSGYENVTVAWQPPVSNGGSSITNYTITVLNGVTGALAFTTTVNTTACVISTITPEVPYNVSITAWNLFSVSMPSDVFSFTWVLPGPSPPLNVRGIASPHSMVELVWDPPADGSTTDYWIEGFASDEQVRL